MAITNGYATLVEIKARLGIADTNDDTTLEACIEAASRYIDNYCNRVFYATTATRYFTAIGDDLCLPDDVLSVTTLKTDEDEDRAYETTWSASDYELDPHNGSPKTMIRTTPRGNYFFPTHRRGVEIAGSFGFNATGSYPDAINEACLLQAARYFRRKDAPFGVAGSPEFQTMTIPNDPDVLKLIAPYIKIEPMG